MEDKVREILDLVDGERLRDLTLRLVEIPSPTGDCADVATAYAGELVDVGLAAEVVEHDDYPASPSVVGRLAGTGGGPTLQFDGHLDTIHTEHSLPVARDGRVYGRGACDMKSGLAVMGELVRVLREAGVRLSGDVLLTAHGLHEAPWGLGESLRLLIDAGYVGDAVFCMEGHPHELPVVGKGLSIFEVDVLREGGPVHENSAPPGLPHPILAGNRLLQEMTAKNEAFAQQELPLGLGHESYFVGVFQSGDFYNRVPATCHIVGTRRYAPDGTFPAVEAEFQEITERVAGETGVTFDTRIWRQRDGFRIDPEADVTRATRDAYETVTGEMLKLVGMKSVADSSIFVNEAEIPAMQYGPGLESAHADLEWVDVEDMVLVTKVCLLAALNYCGRS